MASMSTPPPFSDFDEVFEGHLFEVEERLARAGQWAEEAAAKWRGWYPTITFLNGAEEGMFAALAILKREMHGP